MGNCNLCGHGLRYEDHAREVKRSGRPSDEVCVGLQKMVEGTIRTTHNLSSLTGRKAAVRTSVGPGEAITSYVTLESFSAYSMALVQCTLQSGKKHQIRAHHRMRSAWVYKKW
jgi:23S rRNA-/tRNA-specific pseudouridylate synthase